MRIQHNPLLMKGMLKAVKRISGAVQKKEKIILYGDSDPDGAASVILLKETLNILEHSGVEVYFPDREEESYGLNEEAVEYLEKEPPDLLIMVDCGITNIKEVAAVQKTGIEVIIIDHHKTLPKLPNASIIVNPCQKGDKYPFKQLANTAIVYKLVKLLLQKEGVIYQPEKFLELVAIATLSDMMPIKNENKALIKEGVAALKYTERIGLRALIDATDFQDGIEDIRNKIISPLNAAGTKNHINEAFSLLVEKSPEKAVVLANILIDRRKNNKSLVKEILKEAISLDFSESPVIFEGRSSWPMMSLGIIASVLCNKNNKPAFIYKKREKESRGSARAPSGINLIDAMLYCSDILQVFGGHPQAAGFSVKNDDLGKLKQRLIEYFNKRIKI